MSSLGPGKMLGERGVTRNLPRSLTAISHRHTNLLVIPDNTFIEFIGKHMFHELDKKLVAVKQFFPESANYSTNNNERLAYALKLRKYRRGDIVIK